MSDDTPKTFDELIAIVKAGTFQDIIATGSPQLPQLMNAAASLFEMFPHDDQMKVMACMVGMILGTLHGEPTAAGTRLGVMITSEHRLQMFTTQVMVVCNESLKVRGVIQPETPPDIPAAAIPGRVLNIATGKRKKLRSRKKDL